jgi:hypothetical protein
LTFRFLQFSKEYPHIFKEKFGSHATMADVDNFLNSGGVAVVPVTAAKVEGQRRRVLGALL